MTYYSDHFGFTAAPFSKEIDDDKLWLPPSKKSVVSDLVECVQERKHAVVTGESGAGKTCVTRAAGHALGHQTVRLTYCHNVTLGRRDFYRHLCHALGVPYGSTAGDVFLSVTRHVEELARERVFPVLLVDEAHLLHQDTLDHLHILLNYGWDSKSLLSSSSVCPSSTSASLCAATARSTPGCPTACRSSHCRPTTPPTTSECASPPSVATRSC